MTKGVDQVSKTLVRGTVGQRGGDQSVGIGAVLVGDLGGCSRWQQQDRQQNRLAHESPVKVVPQNSERAGHVDRPFPSKAGALPRARMPALVSALLPGQIARLSYPGSCAFPRSRRLRLLRGGSAT